MTAQVQNYPPREYYDGGHRPHGAPEYGPYCECHENLRTCSRLASPFSLYLSVELNSFTQTLLHLDMPLLPTMSNHIMLHNDTTHIDDLHINLNPNLVYFQLTIPIHIPIRHHPNTTITPLTTPVTTLTLVPKRTKPLDQLVVTSKVVVLNVMQNGTLVMPNVLI